jgi:enoyl-CoA hydratase/carnithine racemase
MNEEVTLEIAGPVATITLARPDSGNLLTPPALRGLERACDAVRDAPEVRCAILTGGAHFCGGWDFESFADGREVLAGDVFSPLASLTRPVIAAIEGEARGGGLSLALAADIRIGAEGAVFAFPEVQEGIIPLGGAVQRLVRLAGRGNALALILTGEPVDAATALQRGIVSEVVPAGNALARATEIAGQIAKRGPIAVRYAKEAVSRGADMPLEQALRFETDLTVLLQSTKDRAEGVSAFAEKREPEFTGE